MRLERIKLVGFKSFVDPTTVELPSNLTGIVGPNGCGKSNVIDAVRWVMGESSAKNLRGESLTDVIFNGTVNRKPVGQASIELVFDNREGKIGGEYAQYNQISVKRQVNRDGQSTYFLNSTKCRRKDITDVFLGTGLGPRSYSIIEQGMISRLIESKPEDLRAHLEEVSGISKYKERRRETENRIKHTKENLARLNDLIAEVDKQIENLKRQAAAAERYKVLKEEERLLRAQSQAIRWYHLDQQLQQCSQITQEQETELEKNQAYLQNLDTQLTVLREKEHESNDIYQQQQSQFYKAGGEVTRLEQAMHHFKERQQQLREDLAQSERAWQDLQRHTQEDQSLLARVEEELNHLTPELTLIQARVEQFNEEFQATEEALRAWQVEWDQFNQGAAKSAQTAEVEQTRIQHIEQRVLSVKKRVEVIQSERAQLDSHALEREIEQLSQQSAEMTEMVDEYSLNINDLVKNIQVKKEELNQARQNLVASQTEWQTVNGKVASLEALQQEALGQKDGDLNNWLSAHHLANAKRLVQSIQVDAGWEQAVECALGHFLQAVCVEDIHSYETAISELEKGSITLLATDQSVSSYSSRLSIPSLASKVKAGSAILCMLKDIYVADNLAQAFSMRAQLNGNEFIICSDGTCLGSQWIRISKHTDAKAGMLQREQELKALRAQSEQLSEQASEIEQQIKLIEENIYTSESQRDELQLSLGQVRAQQAEYKTKLQANQSRLEQLRRRLEQLQQEESELLEQLAENQEALQAAKELWQGAMQAMEGDATQRELLLNKRDECRERYDDLQSQLRLQRDALHQMELQEKSLQSQQVSLQQNLTRLDQQQQSLKERFEQLKASLAEGDAPLLDMQSELEEALQIRLESERALQVAKQQYDECQFKLRDLTEERMRHDQSIQTVRTELERYRMQIQEWRVRCNTIQEQLVESGFDTQAVLNVLEDRNETRVNQELEQVVNKIQRLGAINLAAIDEYKTQSERKTYLDAQNADLLEALETLESAIRKIDKETKDRFKETFDIVNDHFQSYFPKVFGGGSAYLELTSDDLLETGVSVMARPPGKKNSTIHLLSGGEKALTAVALIFSLFQLNPAPFCILDEVDAPLDDTNVGRYCNLVKEMSSKVQFIFITHNKIAMEMAEHLTGVTMHEPGVSRIVSVNVSEAAALAEA